MSRPRGLGPRVWLGFVLLLVLPGWAASRIAEAGRIDARLVPALVLVASVVTFGLYAIDKRRAEAGAWRIPEATLHVAGLLGGWPGGFLARHVFRHKTAKFSFRVLFWLIVALHQAAALDVVSGGRWTSLVLRQFGTTK